MEHAVAAWKRCVVQRGASMVTHARLCKRKTKLIQGVATARRCADALPAVASLRAAPPPVLRVSPSSQVFAYRASVASQAAPR